jgi:hypothetical protein
MTAAIWLAKRADSTARWPISLFPGRESGAATPLATAQVTQAPLRKSRKYCRLEPARLWEHACSAVELAT